MSIEESNVMIAEFMDGWQDTGLEPAYYAFKGKGYLWNELEFHSSWDWLMPVCQKIKTLRSCSSARFWESIDGDSFSISNTYKYVVNFITQYNKEN